jgi:D-alanyl-D-alanine carboxypeptidase
VVLGSPSPAVRAVKAAQLFERGFQVGPLSWLTPGLGQLDALQPLNVDPPNLRETVCGKNRRRPPSEEAENDPLADAPADSPYAAFLSTLRGPGKSVTGPLLQDVRLGEPVRVFTGPPHAPSEVAPGEAKAKTKAKSKTAKGKKSDDSKVANTAKSTPEAKKKAAAKAAPKDAPKKEAAKKDAKKEVKKDTVKKEATKKDGAKKDAQATAKVTAKTKSGAKKSETPAKQ